MNYISTRGDVKRVQFTETVLMGLASDGGLMLPENIPDVQDSIDDWRSLDYRALCLKIMSLFVDIDEQSLDGLIKKSYAPFREQEVVKVVNVGGRHILELFHGPTLAFKDIALQFLGNVFEHILQNRGGELNIIAATSGDTGSAAIQGVRNRENIRIFVMHPLGRVSRIQELQMTSILDENVLNIAVKGTFDDCQSMMKEVFSDLEFKKSYNLGSVNSINWARLLAQIVYYFYSAFRVMDSTGAGSVSFSVPTGNFGDIFAGFIARKMGLPIEKLILATNTNDILTRFFTAGDYSKGDVEHTLSPSMDIQVASNFERYMYYRVGEDPLRLRSIMDRFSAEGTIDAADLDAGEDVFTAGKCDDEATLNTIRTVWEKHGYLLDPHTAAGWKVADEFESNVPVICLATAHPAKFPEAVIKAAGQDIARHDMIDELAGKATRCSQIDASSVDLKEYVKGVCRG